MQLADDLLIHSPDGETLRNQTATTKQFVLYCTVLYCIALHYIETLYCII